MSALKIKSEPSFYTNDECLGDDQRTNSDEEGVYYIKRQPTQKDFRNTWNKNLTAGVKIENV